ncbi:MAG: Gfo/Idh/MocA family oxidoreductase [Bryobacteraceae bacterium]|nr:Gfo/Idh/MocA family oxidoreductase [Bryobacteraceae bacterium]
MIDRRNFVAMTAASYQRVLGANEKLRVANIGCGRRGLLKELIQVRDAAGIEISAVCDIWKQRREKAAADVKEFTGVNARQVHDYMEVLADKTIDAVIIGTPDHQHCTMLIEAIRAGKDVYIEKPLAMNMKELIRAYDAVKKSDRIVQVGTQMRSYKQAAGAKQLIASGGLGKVLKVEQVRNGYSPYWMSYGGREYFDSPPTEQDTDWKAFLMGQRSRPFNAKQYQGWFGFRDFSRGPHTNLAVHFFDIAHYLTGAQFPRRAVAMGGTFRWKDEYDAPDSVEIVFEYAEGFLVRYCTVFGTGAGNYAKWFGTRGTLDARSLSARESWMVSGQGSGEPDRVKEEFAVPESEPVPHMQNFLECVRTRKEPLAPIEAGYGHSVACIMADDAMTSGRRMVYDHSKRDIHPG